jgi:pyrroloquinoline quinone biosynthesis protein B
LAVSADEEHWLLLNASPDIRQQIALTPALHPQCGSRHSPISAVLVTNGDVDHIAGLLGLRERQAFTLYGTAQTLGVLEENRVFNVLAPDLVRREMVGLDRAFEPLPGLVVELFAVPGKVPLWLEEGNPSIGSETDGTVGVVLAAKGRRLVYVPGCAGPSRVLYDRIEGADLLLFDGTLWRDDEMIEAGVGTKTGRRMGHMPMSGVDGSIAALAGAAIGRRVFVHINNTNAALVDGSPERAAVEAAGWAVAHDGMGFSL